MRTSSYRSKLDAPGYVLSSNTHKITSTGRAPHQHKQPFARSDPMLGRMMSIIPTSKSRIASPAMPVSNAAIHVWLEHTPDLDPDPTTGSRKRKRLAEINANAAPRPMMLGDATTTAKRSVKRRQAGVARNGSDNDDNFDSDGGQPTPRPRTTRKATEATAAGGAYDTGSAAFADALRQNAPVLTPRASALAQTASRSRSARSSPTRSPSSATSRGAGRAKSPIKTMADLSIAAKPPRLCSGREAPVPDDVRQLHAQLDLIQAGEALIPADVRDFFHGPNSQLRD
ncbi:hypothetical protein DL765_011197 [Monosporascus sp. GIB2]|nr:hypothetical protein DL765_011197 [Monosporascus sp. GIB2]